MSYIDSVIFGNAIPSGIDAKVRTIYESARKISEFFPELPFLWTKPYVFGDEKAVPEVEIGIQGLGRVLADVKVVIVGLRGVLSSVKVVAVGIRRLPQR